MAEAPVDPALVERYCVKLGNLHEKETEETVKALCVANLPLHTILAVRRLEKWPRLAFVDLATHDAATKLIQALNKKSVNGRVINVETSTSNKPVASRDTFLQSPTDAKTASDTLATLPPPPDGTTPTSEIPKVVLGPYIADEDELAPKQTGNDWKEVTASKQTGKDREEPVTSKQVLQKSSKPTSSQPAKPVHKAAGVLPLLIIHDRIHVLIPKEYRSTRCCLSILGGKADYDSETPQKTAAREFSEETAKIVSQEDATTLVQGGTKVYIPEGKYTLFIFLMSRDKHADIPPKYAKKYFKSFDAEAASLHWIPFENVIQALDKGLDSIALSLREDGPKEPYDDFLPKVFRNTEVLKCIDEIVRVSLRSGIEAEIDRIEKLYQSPQPEQEFNSKILGRQWRLCLEAPPQPPPSPIQTLNPKSEEYVKTLAGLPDQIKQRVVRVRMVNVTTRTAVYNNAFRANRGTPTEPLFHGTPDQWRATAIAMHGFDLKHRLHGRALGDGIYTAADPAVSVGYAKSNGSIIQLRGNITVMGNDKTISQGTNVHVFPNPAHVLPLFILDMDSVVDKHVDNDMQYEEAEEQRKKTLAEMNKKEEAMLKDAFQRWTASAKFYLNQLLAISSRLTTESLYGSSDLQLANWRAYMREKRQFEQRLPIYSSKATIIEKVQNNQITILISSTGSGKSTQLPQYIRDDVIPSSDPRSVAVLQPRRINAVALSSRVSHERDSWVGGETGYSLGGGKACTSRQTRIEFMTHGLFLQKCAASSKNDFESIVSNYAAIIVDEAHERSVEIDLILGLLALLVGRNKDASSTPKIIICSATISFVANQLCDYFKAGGAMTVAKLELPGFSFPVHVQHRSDLNPDPKEIGTAGFSRVMCSYAVQTAIDMVRQTPSGNILVFLPGAGDIRTALMAFKATINDGSSLDSSMRSRHLRRGSDDHNVDTPNVSDSDGDDDGSGGVDYSDSHHNDLHFTCKFAVTSKPKSAMKTLGVFGVHGRVSAELQHAILEPTEDRIIVFTTNVAETGLTIPEIRYVVDTGLERRVRWNQEANLSEMETVQITKSSMHQRTGRAGRVSSGICVRLYSEETAEKFIEAPQPAIQSGEVLKTVLRLRSLESPPKLLVEIPDEVEEKCIEILQSFGALDKDGEVSNTGRILLKLGLDLRLGMFLLACQKLGCLGAGSYIAAVCSVEAQEYFLPGRDDPKSPLLKYVSSMGDHLTILCAYDAISRMDPEPRRRFCNKTKIPLSVLDEIGAAHVAIVAGLTGVQFNVVDELGSKNELWRAINTAVAVGYFDHLVAARSPGSPSQQFVWILDSRLQSDVEAVVSTFKYQHAPPPIPSVNNAGANIPPVESAPRRLTSHGATSSGDSSSDASESPSCKEDLTVTLGSRSALWHIGKSKSNTLAIFSSVLLTDGSNYVPSVKTMSYVTEECLDKAMGILKLDIDLSRLARANTRLVTKFDIKTVDHAYLVKKNPQFLKDLRRQFPQLVIAVADSKDHLIVSAPKHIATFAIESIKRRLANIHPELIKLKIPEVVDLNVFVGKEKSSITKLRHKLQEMGAKLGDNRNSKVTLDLDRQARELTLTVEEAAKPFIGIFMGRIKSALFAASPQNDLPQLKFDATGSNGEAALKNPRLMQLAIKMAPQHYDTRDQAMLLVAHALIWQSGCTLYGGFVRDWVIRDEPANDIDALLPPSKTSQSVVDEIMRVLAPTKIRIRDQKARGIAFTIVLTVPGNKDINVDLVDKTKKQQSAPPPGVDCDAGNLCVGPKGILEKLNPAAGGSRLSIAVQKAL